MTGMLEVWAPKAQAVDVVVGEGRTAMNGPDERGWYRTAAVAEIDTGADYAFSLDGGPPLPDPRSPWQPHGVHGPSRRVDHGVFAWTDAAWAAPELADVVVYELHVGTFSPEGTFDGAIAHLDHLVALGITAVEVMPVAEFPGRRGWGYDGVHLWAPHSAYGGPDGFKRLVDACHARDLAVVLDVVYNHLGPDGNYLPQFGPYFTDRYSTPWGEAVNFDGPDSDDVRDFVVDNACMWVRDYHVDGLRLDAVHAIVDTSAVHVVEEVADAVHRLAADLGRRAWVVAESDLNDPRVVRGPELGGWGCDAQWSDDFHHALHALLTRERTGYYADFGSLAQLAKALRQAYVYDGCRSQHRRRRHGRPPTGLAATRFFGFAQNHDQVGNRATGERSAALMGTGRLKIAAALVLCSPFVPMLFQGEEWGASTPFQYFTDHGNADLGRAVSEGRRREFAAFGWDPDDVPDPQDPETFRRSRLDWDELGRPPHDEVLAWHRELLGLRREVPALAGTEVGAPEVRFDEAAGWLVLQRGPLSVVCNLSDAERRVPLDGGGEAVVAPESVLIVG
ncbi:MAG TPA: malto-oligosyltrehalose trehalohydrolase [Acidimicrobiales bacterium]|jgi:maltooligosyltrehalose trehalohydrolase|nr:malto-oligosyltrehalose trehalohydrolase [Acidimicrobiales bacterium]